MATNTPVHDSVSTARGALEHRLAEIDGHITALESERARLAEALALLADGTPTRRSAGPVAAKPRAAASRRKTKPGRVSNRDRAVAFVEANPRAEAGAIVDHLGASRGVVYNLLTRLVDQEALVREDGDGGRARYSVPSAGAAAAA